MRVKTMSLKDGELYNIDQYPNFFKTGNISEMRKRYYGEDAMLIQCGNHIYYVGNFKNDKDIKGKDLYFNYAK